MQWMMSGFLVLVLATRAQAVWGPFGGVARLESEVKTVGTFDGFEVGVIAFGPNGEGFWQATFTRLDENPGAGRITRAGGRLNFAVLSGASGQFYAGLGGGRNWVVGAAETRKFWSYGAQAGLLVSPADVWRHFPGRRPSADRTPRRIGATAGSLLVGADAGWTQGPVPVQGFEFHGFVTLLY